MLIKSKLCWSINTDDLIQKINQYSRTSGHGKFPNYLIMNSMTFKMLKDDSPINFTLNEHSVFKYYGIVIAISEHLSDYEIDLVG